jgi:hypothetical protein
MHFPDDWTERIAIIVMLLSVAFVAYAAINLANK